MELESAPHASGPATASTSARPSLARDPSSNSGRPKGILKNAHPTAEGGTVNEGVRWDEVNLNLNEVEKEATTRMQITEPKTPYVRYNAETDEVMDLDKIPGFELGQAEREDQQQSLSQSTGEGDTSNANHDMHEGSSTSGASDSARPTLNNRAPSASSRSSSFSGSRRGSETSRRGSDVSERKMVVVEDLGPGADAEDEGADEETRKAKKEFKERRGSHYSGEGEVMKRFRAGMIKDDEDEDEDNDEAVDMDDEEDDDDQDESSGTISGNVNGQQATGVNGQGSRRTRNIPPVPSIPNGLA